MRPPVPEETKQEVIRLWLLGYGRLEIATLVNTSHGTVFNITEKWENDTGKPEAKAFRELAKSNPSRWPSTISEDARKKMMQS
jgi:hypothetical protein